MNRIHRVRNDRHPACSIHQSIYVTSILLALTMPAAHAATSDPVAEETNARVPPLTCLHVGKYAPADFYVTDVATDAAGNVYATDWFHRTVSRYASDGTLQLRVKNTKIIGKPRRIAVDGEGTMYVTDPTFSAVHVINSSGRIIKTWPVGNILAAGGIQFLPPGRIAVSSPVLDAVVYFDKSGNQLSRFGTKGTGPGQFESPMDMVATPDGQFYVVDAALGRIQKFDANGNFLWMKGQTGVYPGEFDLPVAIALDSQGNIFISDRRNYRVQKFDANGNFITTWGTKGTAPGQFQEHNGLDVASDGSVWVAGYHGHDIQHFDNNGNLLERWQGHVTSPGEFGYAAGVGIVNGILFANDQINQTVQAFNARTGTFLYMFGERGEGEATVFNFPRALTTGPDGDLYIADDRLVRRIKPDGTFVQLYKSISGNVSATMGLAVSPGGLLYQADTNNHKIIVRDINSGTVLNVWGTKGTGAAEFTDPHSIAIGPDGSIYITDANSRVQHFTFDGHFIDEWKTTTNDPANIKGSYGLAIDQNRKVIYVGSSNELLAYDLFGHYLFSWAPTNPVNPGVFRHIAIGLRGMIFASDYRGTVYSFVYPSEITKCPTLADSQQPATQ